MLRALLLFSISATLSVITLYSKSEHSFDYQLVLPAGIYFIIAFLLAFRPKVTWQNMAYFTGISIIIWLFLFSISYNLLFIVFVPLSGGLGAWSMSYLSKNFLNIPLKKQTPIIITGVLATILGILFMIAVKKMPKETFTIGLKTGVIVALWQLGVGLQMMKMIGMDRLEEDQ